MFVIQFQRVPLIDDEAPLILKLLLWIDHTLLLFSALYGICDLLSNPVASNGIWTNMQLIKHEELWFENNISHERHSFP